MARKVTGRTATSRSKAMRSKFQAQVAAYLGGSAFLKIPVSDNRFIDSGGVTYWSHIASAVRLGIKLTPEFGKNGSLPEVLSETIL